MILEIIVLGGYGVFVWPAFIFTFVSCFFLYQKTKKEFIKYEKIFSNKYMETKVKTIETKKKKVTLKEALPSTPTF